MFVTRYLKSAAVAAGLLMAIAAPAAAGQINVAVAANFTEPAKEVARLFKEKTGHEAVLSFGATGQFYTQITQEAPFQVFLAADQERPKKLVEGGFAVASSRFTYAVGKLVLWSKTPGLVTGKDTLTGAIEKIAICDPAAAPYGAAAVETLKSLGAYDRLKPKLVQGANISQAYQFVETGNAEIGFVALSQVAKSDAGSRWIVPQELYAPIRQDAVLLKKGEGNEAAKAFVTFLKGPEARKVIEGYGYALDGGA
jgi:molybdate transport system substrate-binding protein